MLGIEKNTFSELGFYYFWVSQLNVCYCRGFGRWGSMTLKLFVLTSLCRISSTKIGASIYHSNSRAWFGIDVPQQAATRRSFYAWWIATTLFEEFGSRNLGSTIMNQWYMLLVCYRRGLISFQIILSATWWWTRSFLVIYFYWNWSMISSTYFKNLCSTFVGEVHTISISDFCWEWYSRIWGSLRGTLYNNHHGWTFIDLEIEDGFLLTDATCFTFLCGETAILMEEVQWGWVHVIKKLEQVLVVIQQPLLIPVRLKSFYFIFHSSTSKSRNSLWILFSYKFISIGAFNLFSFTRSQSISFNHFIFLSWEYLFIRFYGILCNNDINISNFSVERSGGYWMSWLHLFFRISWVSSE